MKIYIVLHDWGYEGKSLLGAYSSYGKAEDAVAVYHVTHGEFYDFIIEEREVDNFDL